jgi:hypothetical protein
MTPCVLGKGTVGNLCTLKLMLHEFEMVTGLKVKFWSSCLVGLNMPREFGV